MSIVKVEAKDKEKLTELFSNLNDSLIISCIQNYFGHAWVDQIENPRSGKIITADFCFLAGEPYEELLLDMQEEYHDGYLILVPESEAWCRRIEEVYGKNCKRIERYGLKKEGDIFDRDKLRQFVKNVEPEFEVRLLDEKDYYQALSEEWSRDWCSQYKDWEDYQKRGLGAVILHNGEIVAGASSYTSYREGIEVQIVTRKDYRRRGLALASGAKLILAALERGLYPNWDAKNMMSVGVAKKLGYHYAGPYTAYEVYFC